MGYVHRPLLYLLISFCCGIFVGKHLSLEPFLLFVLTIILQALLLFRTVRRRTSVLLPLAVFVLLVSLFVVSLFVGGETKSVSVEEDGSVFAGNEGLDVYYFYVQGCSPCEKVKPFIAQMEQKYPLQIHRYDIYTNRSYLSLFDEYSGKYGLTQGQRGTPAIFVSDASFHR